MSGVMGVLSDAELAAMAASGFIEADRQLTLQAACGFEGSQRALLDMLLEAEPQTFERLRYVELLARFLALRGDALDVRRFAGILWQLADCYRERGEEANAFMRSSEAAQLMCRLADSGDGTTSNSIAAFAESYPDAWAMTEAAVSAKADELPQPEPIHITAPPLALTAPASPGILRRTAKRLAKLLVGLGWGMRIWWWGISWRWESK